jgi:hypothetical protein
MFRRETKMKHLLYIQCNVSHYYSCVVFGSCNPPKGFNWCSDVFRQLFQERENLILRCDIIAVTILCDHHNVLLSRC